MQYSTTVIIVRRYNHKSSLANKIPRDNKSDAPQVVLTSSMSSPSVESNENLNITS